MRSIITITMKPEEIVIKLNEEIEQEQIIEALKRRIPELKKLYKEEKTPILITGKILKNSEIDEIQDIIQKSIKVEVKFDSPRKLGLSNIKRTFKKEIATSETKFHKGSVRSGQKIEFEGSLVILGDVNAGAEVIAGENIVVLGILRGLAHAGAKGNKEAIISSALIEAPQLRIADIVKEIEKEENIKENPRTYAYLDNENKIIIT